MGIEDRNIDHYMNTRSSGNTKAEDDSQKKENMKEDYSWIEYVVSSLKTR